MDGDSGCCCWCSFVQRHHSNTWWYFRHSCRILWFTPTILTYKYMKSTLWQAHPCVAWNLYLCTTAWNRPFLSPSEHALHLSLFFCFCFVFFSPCRVLIVCTLYHWATVHVPRSPTHTWENASEFPVKTPKQKLYYITFRIVKWNRSDREKKGL